MRSTRRANAVDREIRRRVKKLRPFHDVLKSKIKEKAHPLQEEIRVLQRILRKKCAELDSLQSACPHRFDEKKAGKCEVCGANLAKGDRI